MYSLAQLQAEKKSSNQTTLQVCHVLSNHWAGRLRGGGRRSSPGLWEGVPARGMATLLQEPRAGIQQVRGGANSGGGGEGGRGSASQAQCRENRRWYSHIQEDCFGSPRRSPFQFQKSKIDSFFPSNVTVYHHWSKLSLCSRTGVPKSCTMDRHTC